MYAVRKRESRVRRQLVRALEPWHAVSIESMTSPGTLDINCTLGWIEVKTLGRWPVRAKTPVRCRFTPAQRRFAMQRAAAGERTWLFLWILQEREWLFGNLLGAVEMVDQTSLPLQKDWYDWCLVKGKGHQTFFEVGVELNHELHRANSGESVSSAFQLLSAQKGAES